jgi:uncharacterized repeat protein (TIGR04076 family)
MTNRKFNDEQKEFCRNILGYDDEQFKIIEENPKQFELMTKLVTLDSKKMVATCIEAENCGMNKIGDKYVFSAAGYMIKNETCEQPCIWAMSNFFRFSYVLYDRVASGLDPGGMHFEYVSCPDTGCKYGGFGTAMFKISIEDA